MLKISQAQQLAYLQPNEAFISWYMDVYMADHLPEFCHDLDRKLIQEMVWNGRKVAQAKGMADPASQAHFVTLMWLLGADFHEFPPFSDILNDHRLSPMHRVGRLYDMATAAQAAEVMMKTSGHAWFRE